MLCRLSTMFKWTDGRVPPNTVQGISRCWRTISSGWYEAFQKHSSWWLGRAPQHPLSRPSSFCGVEESFRFFIVQTFNNVQMNEWSCSPKHFPAHFTVWKTLFVWIVWSVSKTFELMAGLWSSKHSPVLFTVSKNRFVWMFCSRLETYKLMAGRRSPISLSQPSSFRGVEESFRFDVMQFFKNIQLNGWSRSPKHGPFLITVLKILLVWMLSSHAKHSSLWRGRAPQHPLSRPSSFRGVEEWFFFDVM